VAYPKGQGLGTLVSPETQEYLHRYLNRWAAFEPNVQLMEDSSLASEDTAATGQLLETMVCQQIHIRGWQLHTNTTDFGTFNVTLAIPGTPLFIMTGHPASLGMALLAAYVDLLGLAAKHQKRPLHG